MLRHVTRGHTSPLLPFHEASKRHAIAVRIGSGTPLALTVSETDAEVDVKMDLPGMKPDEIDIQVHNTVLTISMPKTQEAQAKKITVKA